MPSGEGWGEAKPGHDAIGCQAEELGLIPKAKEECHLVSCPFPTSLLLSSADHRSPLIISVLPWNKIQNLLLLCISTNPSPVQILTFFQPVAQNSYYIASFQSRSLGVIHSWGEIPNFLA